MYKIEYSIKRIMLLDNLLYLNMKCGRFNDFMDNLLYIYDFLKINFIIDKIKLNVEF